MKKQQLLSLLLVLAGLFLQAQNKGFNYKALITDNNTALANQSIDVRFTILENGTTIVYEETQTTTSNESGIIMLNVGEGTATTGDFSTINWENEQFLKVEINTGNGFVDFGTTAFKYVPYAKYADKAGNVFSGNFNDLSNIPAGLSDGDDDTHLTEAEVDNYVSNNGYLTSEADGSTTNELQTLTLSGTQLSISNGNNVNFTNWDTNANDDFSGNFNDLTNIPLTFLKQGTTDYPIGTSDNIFHLGRISLGYDDSLNTQSVLSLQTGALSNNMFPQAINIRNNGDTSGIAISNLYQTDNDNDLTGFMNNVNLEGNGKWIGFYNRMQGNGSGDRYGAINTLNGTGTGEIVGVLDSININTGYGYRYGTKNYFGGSGYGINYGLYSYMNTTGYSSNYGIYNKLRGSAEGYQKGTINDISNSVATTQIGTHNIINSSATNGKYYGVYNYLSNQEGQAYGEYNRLSGDAKATAINNELYGEGTYENIAISNLLSCGAGGSRTAVFNKIEGSNDGTHKGTMNYLLGDGDGSQFATYNYIENSGNGTQYSDYNVISSQATGTGSKYGIYSYISPSAGGIHYAIYASASKQGSYAGYFNGDVYMSKKLLASSSGTADMKAYVYGKIYSSGSRDSDASSNGYYINKVSTGRYKITFTNSPGSAHKYLVVASMYSVPGFILAYNSDDYFEVYTYDTSGNLADRDFNFVVYKK